LPVQGGLEKEGLVPRRGQDERAVASVASSTSFLLFLPPPPLFVVFPDVRDNKRDAGGAKYQWPDDGKPVVPLTVVFEEVEVGTEYAGHGRRGEQ